MLCLFLPGAYADELEHSGLARQVSSLLTNHLARATGFSDNEAAGSEALQEVLSLLNNLSRLVVPGSILPLCRTIIPYNCVTFGDVIIGAVFMDLYLYLVAGVVWARPS